MINWIKNLFRKKPAKTAARPRTISWSSAVKVSTSALEPARPQLYVQSIARSDSDDGFLDSLIIGAATNSTVTGALLGGNFLGAAIGDAMVPDTTSSSSSSDSSSPSFDSGSGSSFDSGSSSDSGSSFDSGSSSSGGGGGDW